MTPLHIGVAGVSAEGAALCYRTLCTEGPALFGPYAHPEVTLHTPSFAEHVACLERGDWAGVAALLLASARKLAAVGADFVICPDNTAHQAMPLVEPSSPVPWLHIAEVVAAEAAARGYRKLGLTGTRWLTGSEVYPDKLAAHGIGWLRPDAAQRERLGRIIMDELVHGIRKPDSVTEIVAVIQDLADRGCDAVVLGCTELPLVIDETISPLPPLDSTRLLARAALRRAAARDPVRSTVPR